MSSYGPVHFLVSKYLITIRLDRLFWALPVWFDLRLDTPFVPRGVNFLPFYAPGMGKKNPGGVTHRGEPLPKENL
jgi:hypothetical protein